MSGDPARRIANELERRGLGTPARLLLDAHRPLAPLLRDAGAALDLLTAVAPHRHGCAGGHEERFVRRDDESVDLEL